jgi:large subunit ribosomal protein L32e
VSKKAAEALYDAGITSVDDLKGKSAEELMAVKGIGQKTADAIIAGLAGGAEGAAEQKPDEIAVVESKKTKGKDAKAKKKAEKGEPEAKPEVVEPEAAYRVKIKAEVSPEVKRALEVRAIRLDQQPAFRKYHWWYSGGRVKEAWRAPKGELSKQRRGFKYRPPRVKVGYGKPALSRYLHPSGFEEVMVANPDQLALVVDPKTQAARIQGGVGKKKAKAIEAAAAEKNIRILNPRRT